MLHGLDQRTASIYSPVQEGLAKVDDKLRSLAETETSPVQPLLQYVNDAGGKRVRPAITLLCAQFHPHDPARPIIMASAVELLHLATLIHDDTVDNSPLRRGRATVSNTWTPHVAVLFGDYVFATSATFVCDTHNIRVIRRFSETIMELASGQLMEYFTAFDSSQARDAYNDRIYRKTASLFCTASESGAILGEAPEPNILPRVWRTILVNRLAVRGFIVTDHADRFRDFITEVGQYIRDGRVKYRESVTDGLSSAPDAFLAILKGGNFGKTLVKVAQE